MILAEGRLNTTEIPPCAAPARLPVYAPVMGTVHEIEAAISKLSRQELVALRDWFSQFDSAAWDKQFEEDVAAGRLDGLADEALADLRDGRCQEM
jgi:hypothetical protein